MLSEAESGSPEFWASETPDAVAVVKNNSSMTYAEWNHQANRVADALSKLGLQAGDRIGMRFRIDFPWFVIQRALQKLDVVQVAVNWKLTPDEALYILKDSGAKGLACDDVDASKWGELDCGFLVTVNQAKYTAGHRLEDLIEDGNAEPRFGPLRANFILYTSGTTGAPKGVPPMDPATADINRLIRYGASVGKVPRVPDNGVVLMSLPVHHGAGPAAAASCCARGGTAVLLDPYDAEEAMRLIQKHRVQVWTAVPTMLLRVQALSSEIFESYDISSITALSIGAAVVPFTLKTWIIEKFGPVLYEAYGCSEAGMISFITPEDQLKKPGSSGKAYDEVQIDIVDEIWNRVAIGETGEIAVNTPMVLKNYLGREALGEDTVKDGFYRTGDVGHLDEDGYLFITDRIKDMIVAGGVNIYPAEIEKAILEHPAVIDCAVIGIPHDEFGEQPLAFIVSQAGATLNEGNLAEFLKSRLASFKLPRQIEFINDLPVSPMGKVLKQELRAPYWKGRERNV
jgi:long-chain acyl-CoA synthetase